MKSENPRFLAFECIYRLLHNFIWLRIQHLEKTSLAAIWLKIFRGVLGPKMETENPVSLHESSSGHHHDPERPRVLKRKIGKDTCFSRKANRII